MRSHRQLRRWAEKPSAGQEHRVHQQDDTQGRDCAAGEHARRGNRGQSQPGACRSQPAHWRPPGRSTGGPDRRNADAWSAGSRGGTDTGASSCAAAHRRKVRLHAGCRPMACHLPTTRARPPSVCRVAARGVTLVTPLRLSLSESQIHSPDEIGLVAKVPPLRGRPRRALAPATLPRASTGPSAGLRKCGHCAPRFSTGSEVQKKVTGNKVTPQSALR